MSHAPATSELHGTVRSLGTILGVWAHPDDEAFLSAGIMAAARRAGQRVVVLTATLGERGTSDPRRRPPHTLARLRRAELDASLGILGVGEHRTLGFPDGGCDDVSSEIAVAQVARTIESVDPDTILTFGPDGFTGHPDHRTVSAWVATAVAASGSSTSVLHATTDWASLERFADVNDRFNVFFAGKPSITPIDRMAVHTELTGEDLELKFAALAAQASQTESLIGAIGRERFRDWVAVESFVEPPSMHTT